MDGWDRGRGKRRSMMAADERILGAVSAMMNVYGYVYRCVCNRQQLNRPASQLLKTSTYSTPRVTGYSSIPSVVMSISLARLFACID